MSAETFNLIVNIVFGICSIAVPIAYKVLAAQIREVKEAAAAAAVPATALATEAKNIALDFAKRFNEFQVHVAANYPQNKRIEDMEDKLMRTLERIESKLDQKQDKA